MKAKLDSSSPQDSFKCSIPRGFNMGVIGSSCTASPSVAYRRSTPLARPKQRCRLAASTRHRPDTAGAAAAGATSCCGAPPTTATGPAAAAAAAGEPPMVAPPWLLWSRSSPSSPSPSTAASVWRDTLWHPSKVMLRSRLIRPGIYLSPRHWMPSYSRHHVIGCRLMQDTRGQTACR